MLRGKDSAHYKNFDTAYITDSIISRKTPVFNNSTTRRLKAIRAKMKTYNRSVAVKKLILFLISALLVSAGCYAMFFG